MKVHSNVLTGEDFKNAVWPIQGAFLAEFETKGSRTHAHRYDVGLAVYARDGHPRRRRNFQHIKNDPEDWVAATYDEWGFFILHLFGVDPKARIGVYHGVENFHVMTGGRFRFQTTTDVDNFLAGAH